MSNTFHNVIEVLSVELWREIFDYFNPNELWRSFRGLNRKIDGIIDQTTLYLDFKKKGSYGYFMKHILPTMNLVNVRSLQFHEVKEIRHFFSIYSLSSFLQIRLLSLDFMFSFNNNSFTFYNQLSLMKNLQLLEIIFWGLDFGSNNCIEEKEFIIRSIFNKDYCPLLKSFIISTCGTHRGKPTIPSLIPTTKTTNIEYLSIDSLAFNDLIKLLPALQNVKSFRLDDQLDYGKSSDEQPQNMINAMPLLPKCVRMSLKLSKDITSEHVGYLLKQTPNLKDLFLWGWYHLLDAKKWELLLSVQCPKMIKLELVCTGPIRSDEFDQVTDDFEQECKRTPFWLERNVTIEDEEYSGHDYRSDIVIRFNIRKAKQAIGKN